MFWPTTAKCGVLLFSVGRVWLYRRPFLTALAEGYSGPPVSTGSISTYSFHISWPRGQVLYIGLTWLRPGPLHWLDLTAARSTHQRQEAWLMVPARRALPSMADCRRLGFLAAQLRGR